MSFNLDDPLAGILSDGSDDSFFDDDTLGKKKTPKKNTALIIDKKSALFDLEESDKNKSLTSTTDKKDPIIELGGDLKKSPTPFKRTLSKESIKIPQADKKVRPDNDKLDLGKSPLKTKVSMSVDKLNILNELSEKGKPAKPIEKGKSSQSLLDDILGGSTTRTGGLNQTVRPVTAAKKQEFHIDSIFGKSEIKQPSMPTKHVAQKQNIKDNSKEQKEGPAKKNTSDDWLGIFQDKGENLNIEEDCMPPWLGGDNKKNKSEEKKPVGKQEPINDKVKEIQNDLDQKEKEILNQDLKQGYELNLKQETEVIPSMNILGGSNEDITAEGAALYLQQQESQLMVALQLKAQEEKLAALQMRQKESQRVQREAVQAQHSQLDAMLRRQAENRRQMQAIISAHQERITLRIKALLGTENSVNEDIDDTNEQHHYDGDDYRETPYLREKKQLLQLLQSLQENHDKEIDLMETSYRRQLAFLEVSLNQTEERMKEESDKLIKFYTEKINWLDEHHRLFKKITEDNLTALSERHKAENEILREQHLENIKILQEHHASLLENIKNAVKQEQVLIQSSASFSSDLKELVADVKDNKQQFQSLVEKVHDLTDDIKHHTDRSSQIRETQINDIILQVKKERELFEVEKNESRDLVKILETRLKQMIITMEEESTLLKQKKMEFEFEKATFNKQTEFAKNLLKKQDEEIKLLREDIQKEYEDKLGKVNEEKAKAIKENVVLVKEKSAVQCLKQELEKMKAELQAQLEEVTEERSKLNIEKQEMHMEGQRIIAKSRDLDLLAKTAIEKQSHADKKYAEADIIQRKYEERIRRIQEHVVSLNSREKQIAKEKVALSRERLTIHNERKQIESRQQCSLCKSTQNMPQYFEPTYTLPESFINLPPSKDYRSANVNSATYAIEQEMAHLMGKNFNLRHSTGIASASNHNEIYIDDERPGDHLQSEATPVESGAYKDYMDPKFMMLRLDVQKVLNNIDQSKRGNAELSADDVKVDD